MTSKQTVTLAEIARELNINPKVARAKARRHSDELPKTASEDNWTFDGKLKNKLVAFLTDGQAEKAAKPVEVERENFRRLLKKSAEIEAAKAKPVAKKSPRKPS